MTVVPQTYTATATWTASQLADIFKQAFIDAGLMTDWFDSFLNTVENRVLRVINDGAKTYGTVYYWFMFTTGGVFVATTNTWNATTHVPTGTQYIDYFSTTTNATTNHYQLAALASATNCTLTRYTSGVNSGASFFLLRNGATTANFMLSSPSFNASAFVDQNKVQFNHLIALSASTSNRTSSMLVSQIYHTRNSYLGSIALRGSTSLAVYAAARAIYGYLAHGNASALSISNVNDSVPSVILPIAENNTNTALAADHIPMFTSPTISPYMAQLPSDFGLTTYYISNTVALQDTFVVSSGAEEWEVIAFAGNSGVDAGRILFCARTV